jgi:3-phosphoshikimate 1-carboxyvinyltransferase
VRLLVAGAQQPLTGTVEIPPSKYHAHRALMLAALSEGTATIAKRTDARHVQFTIQALRDLGVEIKTNRDHWQVTGRAGGAFSPPGDTVDVGSSGTTLYFLIGLACLGDRPVTFTGQRYFKRRPIGPLLRALERLGVRLEYEHQALPVTVHPGRPRGGSIHIDGTLSQWISGLLMLAPFARTPTTIQVEGELNERPYLELTVAMMAQWGLTVDVREDWREFTVAPNQTPTQTDILLPPDIGSVAFGLTAAALHPAKVTFVSPTPIHGHPEARVLEELQGVGVPIQISPDGLSISIDHDGTPPVAGRLDMREIPDMVPILSTLAARARGRTVLSHVSHVRLKESDRVVSMLQLRQMGARVEFDGNDMEFHGVKALHGAALSSYNDHRVLMALAIAGSTATSGITELSYPHAYRISYPEFVDHMTGLGIPMAVSTGAAALTRETR